MRPIFLSRSARRARMIEAVLTYLLCVGTAAALAVAITAFVLTVLHHVGGLL